MEMTDNMPAYHTTAAKTGPVRLLSWVRCPDTSPYTFSPSFSAPLQSSSAFAGKFRFLFHTQNWRILGLLAPSQHTVESQHKLHLALISAHTSHASPPVSHEYGSVISTYLCKRSILTMVTPLVSVKYSAVLSKMCQQGRIDTKTSPTHGFIGLPSDRSKEFCETCSH